MKIKPIILALSAVFIFNFSCTSQDKSEKQEVSKEDQEASIEEKATEWIKNKYPDVSDIELGNDDNGYLEIQFKSEGDKYRADFTQSGVWIETEESIDWDDLPDAVKEAVESEFDKDDIAELEYVDSNEKGKFYDVEFKDPGKNVDVMYREDGSKI